jgi:uncharacterized membrane protein
MRNPIIKQMAFGGLFAALYILSTALNPVAYGPVQFRISEIFLFFPFWNRKFVWPSIVGVLIANFFSPLGLIDVLVGTSIALIAYYGIPLITKNRPISIVLYAIVCGVLVGVMLNQVWEVPLFFGMWSVALSQLIIGVIAYFFINTLDKRKVLKRIAG